MIEGLVVSSALSSLSIVRILGFRGKVSRELVIMAVWPITIQPLSVAGVPGSVTATDPLVLSVISTV